MCGSCRAALDRRFAIRAEACPEILARLLALNHERHAEGVAAGLHDTGKSKRAAPSKNKPASAADDKLFPANG